MEKPIFSGENKKLTKMYEVPGQDKISEHSFARYKKDREKLPKETESIPFSLPTHEGRASESSPMEKEIRELPIEDIPMFIRSGLKQNDPEIQKICVDSIGEAPFETRSELLREAFEIENEDLELACVKAISNIPEKDRPAMIRIGLSKPSFRVKKETVKMIEYAPSELQAKLIRQGLSGDNIEIMREYAKVIQFVSKEKERKELLGLAKQKLGNTLVEPPLYHNSKVSAERFSREEFAKTGSGTTLIGGELKDKVIFRHITQEAFRSWQEVYENHELWKRAGFEYVPIESILSFHQKKDGLVDVASGVLDISLGSWMGMSGDFSKELVAEANKIKNTLEQAQITHGHPHEDNFCLRFFRKANGDVDYQKKPRIYLIDFDRAVSPK